MSVRYPHPLRPGNRIGITSPSSGVPKELRRRLDVAIHDVEARGYEVVVGRCMDGAGHVSAPTPPNRYRATGWDDYRAHPEVREYTLDTPGRWTRLDGEGDVEV